MSAPAAHRLLLPQLHALAAAAASSAGARLLLAPPGAWHDSSAAPQAVRAASSTPAPDASSHPATGSATGHRRPRFYRTVGVAPAQPSGEQVTAAAAGRGAASCTVAWRMAPGCTPGTPIMPPSACAARLAAQGPGYQVFLDARPIKTPGKNALVLPSYSLALAIAAEWEWQVRGCGRQAGGGHVRRRWAMWGQACTLRRRARPATPACPQRSGKPQMHTMPMMSIAATALDQVRARLCHSPHHACGVWRMWGACAGLGSVPC